MNRIPATNNSRRGLRKNKVKRINRMAPTSSTPAKVLDHVFPLLDTLSTNVNIVQAAEVKPFITSTTTIDVSVGQAFRLDQVNQYVNLAAVFDQYRIRMVEVTLIPRISEGNLGGTGSGLLHTVIDYDDAATVTTAAALDYANLVTVPGYQMIRRTFRPAIAGAAYTSGGVFTGYTNAMDQWLDCSSPTIEHYGLKTVWTVTNTVQYYDASIRFWLEFRNLH
jgi:hypothetical protein